MYKDIIGKDKGSIIVNDKKYYFKRNDAYVEILVEKIADLFGFKHAHYIPITIDDKRYYLSEDLNESGDFKTAYEAGVESNSIRDIRDFVLYKFPKEYDRLMDDIMKMYFMDLMILNVDRNTSNWGFITNDNHTDICILDNDLSFIWYNSCMTSCDNHKQDSYREVYNIFECFPKEYIDMFNNMYDLLDYDTLERLIEETEEDLGMELPYKDNYLSRFSMFREHIDYIRGERSKQYKKTGS